MAPKRNRNRHGQARGRTAPRRLDDDLKRHQLAHLLVPDLVEATERFLDRFPRITRRRAADRIVSLDHLASDILAWTALGASRDGDQLPARCFASSCLLDSDPHRISWQALAMSGMETEVRTCVRAFASDAPEVPSGRLDFESLREEADSVLDEVRVFGERLRGREATSADGLRLGRQLLGAALALDPEVAENGVVGNLTGAAALGLLSWSLPTDHPGDRLRLAAWLEQMATALPSLVDHAAAHLEDDGDEYETEADEATGAGNDEELEEDDARVEELFPLDDVLAAFDVRLSETEDASEGADLAFQVACALLIHGVNALRHLPLTFEARVRAIAAGDALMSDAREEGATPSPEDAEARARLEAAYSRAAALLEADVAEQPLAAEPVEVRLSELDELVEAMQEVADNELVDELAGALALIGGASQTLRVGIRLGHQDADTGRRMAAALGTLDPLALADLAEARAGAARTLRELAGSRGRSAR